MIGDKYHPIRPRNLIVSIPASLYAEIDRARMQWIGYGGKPMSFSQAVSHILGAKEEQ